MQNITKKLKIKQKGITLIALVITIIVLLILAGVSIAMLTGENGILTKAKEAKRKTEEAAADEQADLDRIEDYITEKTNGNYVKEKGVNSPQLTSGMQKVMFNLPEGENQGTVIKEGEAGFDSNNWYDYKDKKWANAITKDGSMWVWIPRYAYKIEYNNPSNKSEGGTIHIRFLIGTTDNYYDENGNIQKAERAISAEETIDTTSDFYVHPAFTNESSINYANGGWDKELTGIWVAKFEAGYASGNNEAEVKASTVKYTEATASVKSTEAGTSNNIETTARNWLDGEYGVEQSDGTFTFKNGVAPAIKYPTFQGATYSMNYINVNDAFNISKALTEEGNIYGFNNSSSDSHLMKNSEWGAVAYLGHSEYGLNKQEMYINNVSLNSGNRERTEEEGKSGVDSVYAVTGVTTGTVNEEETVTTIENIKSINGNNANSDGVYLWNQIEGQKASSTGNMYGIYDLSGGNFERIASYIANGDDNLKRYGDSLTYEGDTLKTTSTKYTVVYPHKEVTSGNMDTESKNNYEANTKIFGDAIRETSTSGAKSSGSWNEDYSYYVALSSSFMMRGGNYWFVYRSGLFAFHRAGGNSAYYDGFRPVIICL